MAEQEVSKSRTGTRDCSPTLAAVEDESTGTSCRFNLFVRWPAGNRQRIIHALILCFLQPIIPMVLLAGLAPLLFSHDGSALPPRPVSFAAVVLVGSVLLVILLGWGLLKIGRVTLVDLGFRRDSLLVELLLGVAGLAAYLACFVAVVHGLLPGSDRVFQHIASYSTGQRTLFLLVGLTIAIFEESVFRGYLQPALIQRLGLVRGVALTALIFAGWHPTPRGLFSLAGFLIRLSLGLVTGLSRGQDRPLTAAITTHALVWPVLGMS